MATHHSPVLTFILVPLLFFNWVDPVLAAQDTDVQPAVEKLGDVILERDVPYGKAGERVLRLDILRPKMMPAKPLPVIVFIHGGAWRAGNKVGGHATLYPFAASGKYFTVSVGYRLSGETIWPAQIHDCKAAIRWLRAEAKRLNIDPDRIGVRGASAGGHLVSMLGTTSDDDDFEGDCGSAGYSSRVTCVVDFCGTSDFIAQAEAALAKNGEKEEKPDSVFVQLFGGPVLKAKREVARLASPLTHVAAGAPPFLIVHGTEDPVVPYDQATVFHAALQEAGVDSTHVPVAGGEHGFSCPEVTERVNSFFAQHLLGEDVKVSSEPIIEPRMKAGKRLARLVGRWQIGSNMNEWEWGVENQCLIFTSSAEDGTTLAAGIIGFDPETGGLIDSRPSFGWGKGEILYTDFSKDRWRGRSRFVSNDGTVHTGVIIVDWKGPDEFQVTTTERLANGILRQRDLMRTYRRISGTPEAVDAQ